MIWIPARTVVMHGESKHKSLYLCIIPQFHLLFCKLVQKISIWTEYYSPVVIGTNEPDGKWRIFKSCSNFKGFHNMSLFWINKKANIKIFIWYSHFSVAKLNKTFVDLIIFDKFSYTAILKVRSSAACQHHVAHAKTHPPLGLKQGLVTVALHFFSYPGKIK